MENQRQRRSKRRVAAVAAAAGFALSHYFDPRMGKARRARARDQIGGILRRTGRKAGRLGRRTRAKGYGALMKARHPVQETKDLSDVTLARKVQSEALSGSDVPEGITVNAEDGVVVLRGEVQTAERMTELAQAVLLVPGVVGVQNLLHLPGEPAPNKASALEASARAKESATP
jgi:hypothetical protein